MDSVSMKRASNSSQSTKASLTHFKEKFIKRPASKHVEGKQKVVQNTNVDYPDTILNEYFDSFSVWSYPAEQERDDRDKKTATLNSQSLDESITQNNNLPTHSSENQEITSSSCTLVEQNVLLQILALSITRKHVGVMGWVIGKGQRLQNKYMRLQERVSQTFLSSRGEQEDKRLGKVGEEAECNLFDTLKRDVLQEKSLKQLSKKEYIKV